MNPKLKFILVRTVITLGTVFVVLFPFAWVLSGFGRWKIKVLYPFWLSMDDGRKNPDGTLANDYKIWLDSFKWRPWGVLLWHVKRNLCYNLVESFKVENGIRPGMTGHQRIIITELVTDSLYNLDTGHKLVQDGNYPVAAGLTYVGNPGDDPYQVNRGDIINAQYSIVGEGEIYFKVLKEDGTYWYGWRYTECKQVTYNFLFFKRTYWRITYAGMNANRYGLSWKHQKLKPIQYTKGNGDRIPTTVIKL